MKLKSFETINTFEKIKGSEYELPKTDVGSFIVDDSCFIPMSEAVKQLGVSGGAVDESQLHYDFADGNDTGIPIPISRQKNVKDIAEISSAIMDDVNKVTETLEETRKMQRKNKEFNDKINAMQAAAAAKSAGPSEKS